MTEGGTGLLPLPTFTAGEKSCFVSEFTEGPFAPGGLRWLGLALPLAFGSGFGVAPCPPCPPPLRSSVKG